MTDCSRFHAKLLNMKLVKNFINDLNAALAQNCISIWGRGGKGGLVSRSLKSARGGSSRTREGLHDGDWGCRMKMCACERKRNLWG